MIKKLVLVTGLSAVFAHASEENEYFFNLKEGHQWAQDDSHQHSDPTGGIYGVSSGIQFSKNWSWDLGYQYHNSLEANSVTIDTWLIDSALRYDWYLHDDISLYGRLGVAYWDAEKTLATSRTQDSTGFSPISELGVSYQLNQNISLSTGYQYVNSIGDSKIGEYDSHAVLFGLTYTLSHRQPSVSIEEPEVLMVEASEVESPIIVTITVPSQQVDIYFDLSSSQYSDEFSEKIQQIADVLTDYRQARVSITGHTDATGSIQYNQKLSQARAQNIVADLVVLGVRPEQIYFRGVADTLPLAENDTPEGRAKNRRVEVKVHAFEYQKEEM